MKSYRLLLLFLISLAVGCSSSESSNVTDGLEQSEIDKYNALMAAEQEAMGAAEDVIED